MMSVLCLGMVLVTATPSAAATTNLNPGDDIQAAINAATAGDTLQFAAGTYNVGAQININKQLSLLGPQAGVDPRPTKGTSRVAGDAGSEAILDGGGSVSQILYIAANNVVINGLEIHNGTGDLVKSDGPITNPTVAYCIIHNSSGDEGVQIKGAAGGALEYNHVYATAGDALNFGTGSTNGTIQQNEVHNIFSPDGGIYCYNDAGGNLNATIRDNLVYDIWNNDGIKLGSKGGSDKNATGGTIADNVVYNCAQDGIAVYSSNVTVEGNEIHSCTSENGALYLGHTTSNITIQNNDIHDNGSGADSRTTWGIRVGRTSHQPTNVTVTNNNIVDNEAGVIYNWMSGAPLDATNNWWGTANGPEDPVGTIEVPTSPTPALDDMLNAAPAGALGTSVSEKVIYFPFGTGGTYPVTVVWVDDDWDGPANCGGHTWQYDAFDVL